MSKSIIGKVALVPKGEYSASIAYKRLDVITYKGSSYMTLKDVVGITPTDDKVNYQLIAEKGIDGKPGIQGEPGKQGIQGPTGPAGKDGTNGKDGINGKDGLPGPAGAKGDIGPEGPAGQNGKDYIPVVKTLTTAKTQLENNTIYRAENLSSIDFTLPVSTLNSIFDAEIDITNTGKPMQVIAPSNIDWMGDDVKSGAWIPTENKRYVLFIYWDGIRYRAISQSQKIGG